MNYNIEDNIDFYAQLKSALTNDKDVSDDNSNLCLITHTPLEDKFVKLDCLHTFNYEPLYKDVFNHKTKYNHLESGSSRISLNQIRCPYCRRTHSGILPYYPELGFNKIIGVNFIEVVVPSLYSQGHRCCFTIIPPTEEGGNSTSCTSVNLSVNKINDKYYCYLHHKITTNEINKAIKKALKDEKVKIISPVVLCVSILKTGVNKGNPCGNRAFTENMCKRHYSSNVKITNNK